MPSTKETIIQLADDLLRKGGYNAFSYADISKPMGIKNAAIHYHFPAKSDLAKAIIIWHSEHFDRFAEKASDRSSADQLKMFLNFYTSIQVSGKLDVIGAYATDWNSMDDATKTEVQLFTEKVLKWLTNVLKSGKKNNEFTNTDAPSVSARIILTNMLAATQLARVTGNDDFNTVKDQILKTVISS